MAQIGIFGSRKELATSVHVFGPGEFHSRFVSLDISTTDGETITFFFNDLEQITELVTKINVSLSKLSHTAGTPESTPMHCNREMWPVINRRIHDNAISREHDTPIWWCGECNYQIERKENTVV